MYSVFVGGCYTNPLKYSTYMYCTGGYLGVDAFWDTTALYTLLQHNYMYMYMYMQLMMLTHYLAKSTMEILRASAIGLQD